MSFLLFLNNWRVAMDKILSLVLLILFFDNAYAWE
jgi:hypothetical protein